MDAFFAAVEQKRDPALRGRPVVVGGTGDPTKRGVVSTASYEARKHGIHSAMPLRTAYKLCPDAVFLPVDYEAYSRESQKVKKILRDISPLMENTGIDEAYLDISHVSTPSEKIIRKIKLRIKHETGLTCSIGIAPNKLLAKIASDMRKPDGFTIINRNDIETLIWPLPVRKLPGVGPKIEHVLNAMGVHTIGELAALSLETLIEGFGKSYGHYLYDAAGGIDESPIITHREPKSIGRETTFQRDLTIWQDIAKALAELTRVVADDMKEEGYMGRTVTVKIRFSDFETHTRAETVRTPTGSVEVLRKAAFRCLKKFKLDKKVRLIGLRVSKLKKI